MLGLNSAYAFTLIALGVGLYKHRHQIQWEPAQQLSKKAETAADRYLPTDKTSLREWGSKKAGQTADQVRQTWFPKTPEKSFRHDRTGH